MVPFSKIAKPCRTKVAAAVTLLGWLAWLGDGFIEHTHTHIRGDYNEWFGVRVRAYAADRKSDCVSTSALIRNA